MYPPNMSSINGDSSRPLSSFFKTYIYTIHSFGVRDSLASVRQAARLPSTPVCCHVGVSTQIRGFLAFVVCYIPYTVLEQQNKLGYFVSYLMYIPWSTAVCCHSESCLPLFQ